MIPPTSWPKCRPPNPCGMCPRSHCAAFISLRARPACWTGWRTTPPEVHLPERLGHWFSGKTSRRKRDSNRQMGCFFPTVNLPSLEVRAKYLVERRAVNKTEIFILMFYQKLSSGPLETHVWQSLIQSGREVSCPRRAGTGCSPAGSAGPGVATQQPPGHSMAPGPSGQPALLASSRYQ